MTDRSDAGERIERLFEQAARRPPGERRAFLAEACGGDEPLRLEIESLLEAEERAGDLLSRLSSGEPTLHGADHAGSLAPGRIVGAYQLQAKIGEGGMSTVFLAARADDQFRKRVAIKLVPLAMASAEHLRRFRTERYILASLDHANIARLHDAGTTDEGLPYFVMEYIEGEPIDAYCDRHRLSIRERLELFRTVCSAVHYAHQNLVVHRDLKPSNVLVTEDGQPKLLDFGIAKLLNPELTSPSPQPTLTWHRVMTPDYASPEQVQGKPITTASDVYSLGVLLYQILVGRLPYGVAGKTPREIEHIVAAEEPERPSTAVGEEGEVTETSSPSSAAVSHARDVRPAELRRLLAGDLDNIVAMALRKEPRRRYVSAAQFSEELRRHLVGLPVLARQDTYRYRTGKFLRRNRVGVGVAVAFLMLILASSMILLRQSGRVVHERDQAQRERDKAQQVATFLEEIFEASDPGATQGQTMTARELLDRAADRIDTVDAPSEIQAALMTTMGRIYRKLGVYPRAGHLLKKALETRLEVQGEDHVEVAANFNELGELFLNQGEHQEAEELFQKSLRLQRQFLGPTHPAVAGTLGFLVEVLYVRGEFDKAEAQQREVLGILRRSVGEEDPATAEAVNDLAVLLYSKGDYAGALPLYNESLEMQRELLGRKHPDVALTLSNMAMLHYQLGDYKFAEELQGEALGLRREVLGAEHPDVVQSLVNLAAILRKKDDMVGAIARTREALAVQREILGDEHPQIAIILNNLAVMLNDQELYQEAESLHREALALRLRLLGDEHPRVAESLHNLGSSLHVQGEHAGAETHLRRALGMRRRLLGKDHPVVGETLARLGKLLVEVGDLMDAEVLMRQALEIGRDKLPADHPLIAEAESILGEALGEQGRFEEAEHLLVGSYRALSAREVVNIRQTSEVLRRIVRLYEAWGEPGKATEYQAILKALDRASESRL